MPVPQHQAHAALTDAAARRSALRSTVTTPPSPTNAAAEAQRQAIHTATEAAKLANADKKHRVHKPKST